MLLCIMLLIFIDSARIYNKRNFSNRLHFPWTNIWMREENKNSKVAMCIGRRSDVSMERWIEKRTIINSVRCAQPIDMWFRFLLSSKHGWLRRWLRRAAHYHRPWRVNTQLRYDSSIVQSWVLLNTKTIRESFTVDYGSIRDIHTLYEYYNLFCWPHQPTIFYYSTTTEKSKSIDNIYFLFHLCTFRIVINCCEILCKRDFFISTTHYTKIRLTAAHFVEWKNPDEIRTK